MDMFCLVICEALTAFPFENIENTNMALEKWTTRLIENWLFHQAQTVVIIGLILANSLQPSEASRGQFFVPFVFNIFVSHLGNGIKCTHMQICRWL